MAGKKYEFDIEVGGRISVEARGIFVYAYGDVVVRDGEGVVRRITAFNEEVEVEFDELDRVNEIAEQLRNRAIEEVASVKAKLQTLVEFPPYGYEVVF